MKYRQLLNFIGHKSKVKFENYYNIKFVNLIVTDLTRVATPTATETMLPWKRDVEEDAAPLQQNEFPAWASNKEYLAYNSPSATFLGKLIKLILLS